MSILWENKKNIHRILTYLCPHASLTCVSSSLVSSSHYKPKGEMPDMGRMNIGINTFARWGIFAQSGIIWKQCNLHRQCCSSVSTDTEVLTVSTVSLCHFRARFCPHNVMFYCSECCFSLCVNATLFVFSLLQRLLYWYTLNTMNVRSPNEQTFLTLFLFILSAFFKQSKFSTKHTLVEFRHTTAWISYNWAVLKHIYRVSQLLSIVSLNDIHLITCVAV